MSPEEHGLASRLVSILLLRFLQPDAFTYKDSIHTQKLHNGNNQLRSSFSNPQKITLSSLKDKEQSASMDIENKYNEILSLSNDSADEGNSLTERLEHYTRFYSIPKYSYGGRNDVQLSSTFHRFLSQGIGSYLSGRPAHIKYTDLIDMLAFSISPSVIAPSSSPLLNFQLNDIDRFHIVNTLSHYLVVPSITSWNNMESPLFQQTLPHLRASIQTYLRQTLALKHMYSAQRLLVNIALYSQHETSIRNTIDELISLLIEDNDGFSCQSKSETPQFYYNHILSCLTDLITKSQLNDRQEEFEEYIQNIILPKLSKMLKKQCMKLQTLPAKSNIRSCKLSSIFNISTCIFRYLACRIEYILYERMQNTNDDTIANEDNNNEVQEPDAKKQRNENESKKIINDALDDIEPVMTIIEAAIEFLSHESLNVVKSASLLIESIPNALFEIDNRYKTKMIAYSKRILKKCKDILFYHTQRELKGKEEETLATSVSSAIQPMLIMLSRQSSAFLSSFLEYIIHILNTSLSTGVETEAILQVAHTSCKCISKLASINPVIMANYFVRIKSILSATLKNSDNHLLDISAALLTCRHAMKEKPSFSFDDFGKGVNDLWCLYKLTRHAFSTANFDIAKEILQKRMLTSAASEKTHLWFMTLNQMAIGEDIVVKQGIRGLVDGISNLNSSLTHLYALMALHRDNMEGCFQLQQKLLSNRIDFFNLCTTAHSFSNEMLLTGGDMDKHTRSSLHVRNLYFCFHALAKRYIQIYQTFGILCSMQTRAALRSLSGICRFMGKMTSKVFCDTMPVLLLSERSQYPAADSSNISIKLIEKLNSDVLDVLDERVDSSVRSRVLSELLGVVLKSPVPFPPDFFSPKALPMSTIRLSADPLDVPLPPSSEFEAPAKNEEEDHVSTEVIDVQPGFSCTIYASGKLPNIYLSGREPSINQVLCRYKIVYDGPIEDDKNDDEYTTSSGQNIENEEPNFLFSSSLKNGDTFTSNIFPDGKFFIPIECTPDEKEGYYLVTVALTCGDVDGNEWKLSASEDECKIFICVQDRADC